MRSRAEARFFASNKNIAMKQHKITYWNGIKTLSVLQPAQIDTPKICIMYESFFSHWAKNAFRSMRIHWRELNGNGFPFSTTYTSRFTFYTHKKVSNCLVHNEQNIKKNVWGVRPEMLLQVELSQKTARQKKLFIKLWKILLKVIESDDGFCLEDKKNLVQLQIVLKRSTFHEFWLKMNLYLLRIIMNRRKIEIVFSLLSSFGYFHSNQLRKYFVF